jgi:alkyl sulfatase BDS1-like metallo-beta-lactamase superfamily hydrolase
MHSVSNEAASLPDSFEPDTIQVAVGPLGQIGHRDLISHGELFKRRLVAVRPGVWSLVGNGLPNHCFIEGPEGLIVIDTNDSVEAMRSALKDLRTVCGTPIAAVIYSHFHYVSGTTAVFEDTPSRDIPIWAHERVQANRLRFGAEIGPRVSRGILHQFGTSLPPDGPDATINLGCGNQLRDPSHAPHTPGWVPPTHTLREDTRATIAGLEVELIPTPSDADDSLTVWFPTLGVCFNNIVWPTLFNVFAIRGEEYRDPRVLLRGLDRILALEPEHLVGAHGPPVSGRDEVREVVTDYRDAIQYLWDQTVRSINKGLGGAELAHAIRLPQRFKRSYFTRQFYGLAEHHVRQIQSGLFGWFDEDPANLFPVEPTERARRLVQGFGGAERVRQQADAALASGDLRWALELTGWLVKSSPNVPDSASPGSATPDRADDGKLQATVLRTIAQRTAASNIRGWCLTRALELEGALDLSRTRRHRFRVEDVMSQPPTSFVPALRVLLDPQQAEGLEFEVRWEFDDGSHCGLRLRGQVAVPTDGRHADASIRLSHQAWAQILGNKKTLENSIAQGLVDVGGDRDAVMDFFACFEHPALGAP